MIGKKICLHCSEKIDIDKDHHVQLNTINRVEKPDEYAYFHFQCWVDYFNQRVQNKMKSTVSMMQEKANMLFNSPMLKPLMENIGGSDMLLNMLNTPLRQKQGKDPVDPKKSVISKIKNGRKTRAKRSNKKRETQV